MAKMTLLEMTQNILSAMSSDEVNSISDTVESLQVAEEIRTTYFMSFANRDIPELEGIVTLEATGDPLRPNTLILPDDVERVKWIKYLNYRHGDTPSYEMITYLDPEEFIKRVVEPGPSEHASYTNVRLLDTSPLEYTIANDRSPSYYTVFNNDGVLVFDSFDSLIESNLTGSNSLAWGIHKVTFELNDDYIPPIDEHLFPLFLAEARSSCFVNVKEVANSKEEQRARRQLVRSQFRTHETNPARPGVFSGTDYSRKR
jgi:hypothetical protein